MKRMFKRIGLILAGVLVFGAISVAAAPPAYAAGCGYKPGDKVNADAAQKCLFNTYINPAIVLLASVAGVAVVAGITYGGILYASSEGDPQKVTKAKVTITRAIIGLATFLLLGAFLQFLSPTAIQGNASSVKPCTKTTSFGLKTWYAYLPDGSFDSNCQLNGDLAILPEAGKQSVLPNIVLAIVDDLLRLTALIAVGYVIAGGVQYITSQAEPGALKKAHSTIINALIGLAIAIVAASVVSFIGSQLTK